MLSARRGFSFRPRILDPEKNPSLIILPAKFETPFLRRWWKKSYRIKTILYRNLLVLLLLKVLWRHSEETKGKEKEEKKPFGLWWLHLLSFSSSSAGHSSEFVSLHTKEEEEEEERALLAPRDILPFSFEGKRRRRRRAPRQQLTQGMPLKKGGA